MAGRCLPVAAIAALLLFCSQSASSAKLDGDHSGPLFQTSGRCLACHKGVTTQGGEDVSIGFNWRATIMANSSRDPYWQAAVRREATDHPEARAQIEDECSVCHMPMARYSAKQRGGEGQVFAHLPFNPDRDESRLAEDGVSCSLCHQIGKENLGKRESFVGRFLIDAPTAEGERMEYGPYKIEAGQTRIMVSSSGGFRPTESLHVQRSELCATCHTLITKALGPDGKVLAPFPEQMPYLEWLNSSYKDEQSCQDCHMPVVKEPVPLTRILGIAREGVSRHTFVGGNFLMLRMLNRYRNELSTSAPAGEMEASADRTVTQLQTKTARVDIRDLAVKEDRLTMNVSVENLTGHKFPTAYPSRRAWLHVLVRDSENRTIFESGAFQPDGSVSGNDNDADPTRFEPHYRAIASPDQVQVYESIMSNSAGKPTTALLSAVRYLKDNRLLPRGFDKAAVAEEIATVGEASADDDFKSAGDLVRYDVPLKGAKAPFRIEAELWYQPISRRWASNLIPYKSAEPSRFVGYYDSMAGESAVVVSRAAKLY